VIVSMSPRPPQRKLLVLDLDETLVHASEFALDRPANYRIHDYHVYERPQVHAFIAWALTHFEVSVWTSSGRRYAEPVVARLFAPGALGFLWCSERCTLRRNWETGQYEWVKPLKKLKRHGYALESMIAVDDTPSKHARNYGNLVTVSEFTGNPDDTELPRLAAYLDSLRDAPNIRSIEKRSWQTSFEAHTTFLDRWQTESIL
jgi:carboxy-terminal domain RNA polymerase II polypeptide A small phosphatase